MGGASHARNLAVLAACDSVIGGASLRTGVGGVRQPRRRLPGEFPGRAEGLPDHLHIGVRRRSPGARLHRDARPRALLDDGGRLPSDRKDPHRKGQEVPAVRRRALHRDRRRRRCGVRLLEDRYPRRPRVGVVAVHAARRQGHALHVELRRPGRGAPAAADEQRRSLANVRGDLHAREPALHHGRHRARRRSRAGTVPAVPRLRRQGRQRRPLSRLLRQRLPPPRWRGRGRGAGAAAAGAGGTPPAGGAR